MVETPPDSSSLIINLLALAHLTETIQQFSPKSLSKRLLVSVVFSAVPPSPVIESRRLDHERVARPNITVGSALHRFIDESVEHHIGICLTQFCTSIFYRTLFSE